MGSGGLLTLNVLQIRNLEVYTSISALGGDEKPSVFLSIFMLPCKINPGFMGQPDTQSLHPHITAHGEWIDG